MLHKVNGMKQLNSFSQMHISAPSISPKPDKKTPGRGVGEGREDTFLRYFLASCANNLTWISTKHRKHEKQIENIKKERKAQNCSNVKIQSAL